MSINSPIFGQLAELGISLGPNWSIVNFESTNGKGQFGGHISGVLDLNVTDKLKFGMGAGLQVINFQEDWFTFVVFYDSSNDSFFTEELETKTKFSTLYLHLPIKVQYQPLEKWSFFIGFDLNSKLKNFTSYKIETDFDVSNLDPEYIHEESQWLNQWNIGMAYHFEQSEIGTKYAMSTNNWSDSYPYGKNTPITLSFYFKYYFSNNKS